MTGEGHKSKGSFALLRQMLRSDRLWTLNIIGVFIGVRLAQGFLFVVGVWLSVTLLKWWGWL